ncbi:MAG: PVC-type heme-binding CxxCH protein [Aureliella sp.]
MGSVKSDLSRWCIVAVASLVWGTISSKWNQSVAGEPTVAEAADAFVLDDGIRIEIAASEPNVIDPVAIRFGSRGEMWVVEMPDYPTGPVNGGDFNGRIRVLQDHDADGFYESATLFADGLEFATGLQPWKDGVIVTLAGSIEFLRDLDGDGRCDERQVWFQGFSTGNEQLRANHPRLGPDGLVYVASGLRGGAIEAVDEKWKSSKSEETLDLAGYDFCFDPQGGHWGRATGNSQFGLTIDDFGVRVACSNRNPGMQSILPFDLVAQSNTVTAADAYRDIALAGAHSRVVAAAETWTTSNLHEGQFSAACGVTIGMGSAFPSAWRDSLLVCEPTSYAVQRQEIVSSSITPSYRRVASEGEFVASKNTWFRPVDLCNGPDGALYIVDMCRAVIEHPDWAPPELRKRPDERDGDRLGRIWRVSAIGKRSSKSAVSTSETQITRLLDSPNPWQRAMASRRLYESVETKRSADLDVDGLLSSVQTDAGMARVLQWAAAQKLLRPKQLSELSRHENPKLRRVVARLVKGIADSDTSESIVKRLIGDSDEGVRFETFQVAILDKQSKFFATELAAIATSELDSAWVRLFQSCEAEAARQILLNWPSEPETPDNNTLLIVRALGRQAAPFGLVPTAFGGRDELVVANVAGWSEGQSPFAARTTPVSETPYVSRAINMSQVYLERLELRDELLRDEMLLCAWNVLESAGQIDPHLVERIALASPSATLSNVAIRWWLSTDVDQAMSWLVSHFSQLSGRDRNAWLRVALSYENALPQLLYALESRGIAPNLIPPEISNRLQAHSNSTLAAIAKEIFSSTRRAKQSLLREYASATSGLASLERGKKLFRTHCAACHRIGGNGTNVGPDISDSRTKSPNYLLTAILLPSASIDGAYQAYRCLTVDDQVYVGLMIDRNATQMRLRISGGDTVRIPAEEIAALQPTEDSFMPAGFERVIDVASMRDLIGYLKGWRYASDNSDDSTAVPLTTALVDGGTIDLDLLQ